MGKEKEINERDRERGREKKSEREKENPRTRIAINIFTASARNFLARTNQSKIVLDYILILS